MTDRNYILRRLEHQTSSPHLKRLRGLLEREDTRLVTEQPSKVSVGEALRLWKTRLKNTDVTGQRLEGAQSFVNRLKDLTPQRKLEQFALIGREATGNVFFDGSTHHFIGAIIIKKVEKAS